MSVTAVIPTTGRTSVVRTVESALLQKDVSHVFVVADGRAAGARTESILSDFRQSFDNRLQLHVALHGGNGSKVRNFGTKLATTRLIAYCDDDDYWLHNKIEQQLSSLGTECSKFSTHAYWRKSARSSDVMPTAPFDSDDLGALLLTRDSLSYRRGFCATPTILVPTDVAKAVGWDEKLRRHQDWDFVMRLQREGNLHWDFLPTPLAVVDATTSSVSRRVIDTQPAEYFLEKHGRFLDPVVAADFATVHIAGVEFRSGNHIEGIRTLGRVRRTYGPPHTAANALAWLRIVQTLLSKLGPLKRTQ